MTPIVVTARGNAQQDIFLDDEDLQGLVIQIVSHQQGLGMVGHIEEFAHSLKTAIALA